MAEFQHPAGWFRRPCATKCLTLFQHTAARRRLEPEWRCRGLKLEFQHTAARRRLGILGINIKMHFFVSTHSRPKAAGARMRLFCWSRGSFNTQPPEGGWQGNCMARLIQDCFNTQPPEGGWRWGRWSKSRKYRFQHTAARRRLGADKKPSCANRASFNTQPPEGGWA